MLTLVKLLAIIMPAVSQQLVTSRDSANNPRDNKENKKRHQRKSK